MVGIRQVLMSHMRMSEVGKQKMECLTCSTDQHSQLHADDWTGCSQTTIGGALWKDHRTVCQSAEGICFCRNLPATGRRLQATGYSSNFTRTFAWLLRIYGMHDACSLYINRNINNEQNSILLQDHCLKQCSFVLILLFIFLCYMSFFKGSCSQVMLSHVFGRQ